VVRFVRCQAPRLHLKRAKLLTSALRSFLHYARYRGEVTHDLTAAVPTVANWSMPSIPRAIPVDAVHRLLAVYQSEYRDGPSRLRDFAVACSIGIASGRSRATPSSTTLIGMSDRWRFREKAVNMLTCRYQQMSAPRFTTYLRHGRPRSNSRRVFLRAKAPIRGLLGSPAIGSLVRHNIARAGVQAPTYGAHQFRHALATKMLRHGASLAEIGEVLRHRSIETTKIYTKVDLDSLRALALPWPGGA